MKSTHMLCIVAAGILLTSSMPALADASADPLFSCDPPIAGDVTRPGLSLICSGDVQLAWSSAEPNAGNPIFVSSQSALSPRGDAVFVTTHTDGSPSDYAIAAYRSGDGAQLWSATYNGPGNGNDIPRGIVASPDGARVFVTGESRGATNDYATIAYDAQSGEALWIATYDGPTSGDDEAWAIGIDPEGARVYVTGQSRLGFGYDYATIAYDALTGEQLWEARYDGAANSRWDYARALAVSPDGTRVFVTGFSAEHYGQAFATVAYDSTTGQQLWHARYVGPSGSWGWTLTTSPNGGTVYVTGGSPGEPLTTQGSGWATIAYDSATGATKWIARHHPNAPPAGAQDDWPYAITTSPEGDRVYVTGRSRANLGDFLTIAYDSNTGKQNWSASYDGPAGMLDLAVAIAASPDGEHIYVTGRSYDGDTWLGFTGMDYATIAYDTVTGAQVWLTRYDGTAHATDIPSRVLVHPSESRLFITGASETTEGRQLVTLAYDSTGYELPLLPKVCEVLASAALP